MLAPRLNAFRAQNPDIEIQSSTAVWPKRMDDSPIDLDIRFRQGDRPETLVWPLGADWASVMWHPDFAARFERELTLAALAASDIVRVTGSERDRNRLSASYGLVLPPPGAAVRAESSLIALQIPASGQGSAIIMRRCAHRYLDHWLLVSPLAYELPLEQGFYLIARTNSDARTKSGGSAPG